MKKIIIFLIFYIIVFANNAQACRCQWEGPFLEVAWNAPLVAVVKINSYYKDPDAHQIFPLAAWVEIQQVIKGESATNDIRVWGDDGKLCRPYISTFDTNSVWVMALYQEPDSLDDYFLSICGAYYLQVDGDSVYGYIQDVEADEPIQTIALSDFLLYAESVLHIDKPTREDFSFELKQNYPNPFNPITNIGYSVAGAYRNMPLHISLAVFNLLGQKMITLVDEKKIAGTYAIAFDAGDLPGGIYFYRLQVGGYVQTHKMILLK